MGKNNNPEKGHHSFIVYGSASLSAVFYDKNKKVCFDTRSVKEFFTLDGARLFIDFKHMPQKVNSIDIIINYTKSECAREITCIERNAAGRFVSDMKIFAKKAENNDLNLCDDGAILKNNLPSSNNTVKIVTFRKKREKARMIWERTQFV